METYNDWLAHFGIEGMKWGQRNGPPYPLTARQMNRKERRENKVRAKEYTSRLQTAARELGKTYGKLNSVVLAEMKKEQDFEKTSAKSQRVTLSDGSQVYAVSKEDEDRFQEEMKPLREEMDRIGVEIAAGTKKVNDIITEVGETDFRMWADVGGYNMNTAQSFYKRYSKEDLIRFTKDGQALPSSYLSIPGRYTLNTSYKVKPPKKNKGD